MTKSFVEIIGLWPSCEALGSDLHVDGSAVRKWKKRDSIPGGFWLPVVNAAKERGIEGVTLDLLASIASDEETEDAA